MAKMGRPSLRTSSALLLLGGMVACTSEKSDVRAAAQPFASTHQSALDTSTYNFESGTQGWTYTSGEVTGVSTSTARAYTGSGDHSLAISIAATGSASEGPYVANPTTPAGVTVTFHVWIPSGSTVTAIKPWAREANDGNWDGNWVGSFNTNAWNTVTLDIPANAATPLDFLGVEFEVSGAWTGTVYMDAIDWPGGSCNPTTCSAQGAQCGTISDGCGGNLNCGSCPSGQSCSSNVCTGGCTPTTCSAAGAQCGTISDGCGGNLNCGSCPSGQSCSANVCTGGGGSSNQYDFDDGTTQGWTASGSIVSAVSSSTAQAYGGTRSLAVSIAATGSASSGPSVANPTTPAGATVTFHVWVPSGSTITALKPWVNQGAAGGWAWTGGYYNSFNVNAWNTVSVTVPTDAVIPLNAMGVEFEVSGAWSGTTYIDSVSWPGGGGCTPTTCAAAGAECGSISDNCGGTLSCGSCPSGSSCSANVCSACNPTTCSVQGAQCGTISDGCGGTLNCGGCPSGQSCSANVCGSASCTPTTYEAETMYHSAGGSEPGGWNLYIDGYISTNHTFTGDPVTLTVTAMADLNDGTGAHMVVSVGGTTIGSTYVTATTWTAYQFTTSASGTQEIRVTFDNDTCCPDRNLYVDKVDVGCTASNCTTCTAQGAQCGSISDNCGGTLNCGNCPSGQSCSANVCTTTCSPTTCSAQGAQCGSISDNCGGTLNCGGCPSGQSCSGNVCNCTPTTCAAAGAQCGSISNGCGGTLNCGGCPSGSTCQGNICGASGSGCTMTSCAEAGVQCGSIGDGCGGTLDCGGCSGGQSCNNNVCISGGGGASSGRYRSVSTRGTTVTISGYTDTLETIAAYQQTADPTLANVRGSTYPNTGGGQTDACGVTWYPWSMSITLASADSYWQSNGARDEQTQVLVRKISTGDVVPTSTGDVDNGPSDSTTCRTSLLNENSAQLPLIYFNGALPSDVDCSGGEKSPIGCPYDCNRTIGCDAYYGDTANEFTTSYYRTNLDGQSTVYTRWDHYGVNAAAPVPFGDWVYWYESGRCVGGSNAGAPCEYNGAECTGGGSCDAWWTVMRRYSPTEDSLNLRRGENRRNVYIDAWAQNKINDVNNREIGLVGRWYNADNYFVFMVREYGGDYARLQRRSGGVFGSLASASPSFDLTNWTRLGFKIIDQGSWTDTEFVPDGNCWLGGYINGNLEVYTPYTPCSQNPSGKYGVFSYYNASSQFYSLTAFGCNPDWTCF